MSTKAKLIKIVLPLLILATGIGLMLFMIAIRPEPQREERKDPGALVEVLTVTRGERQVHVSGTGTVQPHQEINLTPPGRR